MQHEKLKENISGGMKVGILQDDGSIVECVVWKAMADAVLVCSASQYERLKKGVPEHEAGSPIGFRPDVLTLI